MHFKNRGPREQVLFVFPTPPLKLITLAILGEEYKL
jgi:hypothetical protein